MNTVKIINVEGIRQIAGFLFDNHKKGMMIAETPSMLQAWANDAEFSLENGNGAMIELLSWDSVHGRTETFTVGPAGISESAVDCE